MSEHHIQVNVNTREVAEERAAGGGINGGGVQRRMSYVVNLERLHLCGGRRN
jgi:hypothetical protein